MSLVEREKIVVETIEDLPPAYWGKPVIACILFAIAYQKQELERVFWDILDSRSLDNAQNGQLETLGRLVGEPRYGRTDAEYLVAIRGRILVNRSHGHYDDLTDLLELMRPGVEYCIDEGDAALDVQFNDLEHALSRVVLPFLRESSGAGIKVSMVAPTSSDDSFTLGTVAADPADGSTQGLSAISAPTIGGKLDMVL